MAYYSGQASSYSELHAVLKDCCIQNGWQSNGNVLFKDSCFIEITPLNGELRVTGGTGFTANQLTGSPNRYCKIKEIAPDKINFPVSYNLHITNKNVHLIINYSVSIYQWLGFGIANLYSNLGTGNWFGASCGQTDAVVANGGLYGYIPGPFWSIKSETFGYFSTAYIHAPIDSYQWLYDAPNLGANISTPIGVLLNRQPNQWNMEATLFPALVAITRASNKVSIAAELQDCRILKLENYEPEMILTLGSERWKIYPFYRRGLSASGFQNSGMLGWAIRYDGP